MKARIGRQRGMTAISWAVVLGIFAFFVLIVLRLSPIYMEHFSVSSSLDSLKKESGLGKKSKVEIWKLLQKRLRFNDVTNVKKEHFAVAQLRGKKQLSINYEVRVSMVANVDAVVSFSDEVEISSP